jgi:transporter family protein
MHYAFIAMLLYASRALISKTLLNNEYPKEILAIFMRVYGFLIFGLAILVSNRSVFEIPPTVNNSFFAYLIVSITAGTVGIYFIFSAMEETDLSNLSPLNPLSTVLTILIAYILLGEMLTDKELLGSFIIVGAASLLSYKSFNIKLSELEINSALKKYLLSLLMMAVCNTTYRVISNELNPLLYVMLLSASNILVFAIIVIKQNSLRYIAKYIRFDKGLFLLGNVASIAVLFLNMALAEAEAGLVSTVVQMQVFIVIGLSYLLLNEKANTNYKIATSLISVVGVFLITA